MRCFLDMKLEYAAERLKKGYTVNYLADALNFSSAAHFQQLLRKNMVYHR